MWPEVVHSGIALDIDCIHHGADALHAPDVTFCTFRTRVRTGSYLLSSHLRPLLSQGAKSQPQHDLFCTMILTLVSPISNLLVSVHSLQSKK